LASAVVVDDNFIMRRKVKGVLKKLGLQIVGEAKNGIQALEKCEKTDPDLVTLDIHMPEMDGIQCLKKLRDKFPDLSVVMITSLSQKEKVLKAIKSGADHYIVKPIEEENVRDVLVETLGEEAIDESA